MSGKHGQSSSGQPPVKRRAISTSGQPSPIASSSQALSPGPSHRKVSAAAATSSTSISQTLPIATGPPALVPGGSKRTRAPSLKAKEAAETSSAVESLLTKPEYYDPPIDPDWSRPDINFYNRGGEWNKVASKELMEKRRELVKDSLGPVLVKFIERYCKAGPTADAEKILEEMGYVNLSEMKERFKAAIIKADEKGMALMEDMGYGTYAALTTPYMPPSNELNLGEFIVAVDYKGRGWKSRGPSHAGAASLVHFRRDWHRLFPNWNPQFCEYYMSENAEVSGGTYTIGVDVSDWAESQLHEAAALAGYQFQKETEYGALTNVDCEEAKVLNKMDNIEIGNEGTRLSAAKKAQYHGYLAAIGIRDVWVPLFEVARKMWRTNQNVLVGAPVINLPQLESTAIPTVDAARKDYKRNRAFRDEVLYKDTLREEMLNALKESIEENKKKK